MKLTCHLVVSDRGSFRVVQRKPSLDANEIAIHLSLDIPDSFFERPYPAVKIAFDPRISDLLATRDHADVAVNLTASYVADALKVDVNEVRDGLTEAVRSAAAVRDERGTTGEGEETT